ncbi:hypothetical protein [Streptomyces sp. NPDC056255]|uniref:hypothetical protein n=1 Tax=Streptomyces sp. NPDC056255 TaxID=3345764 RepID=UPI0035D9BF81
MNRRWAWPNSFGHAHLPQPPATRVASRREGTLAPAVTNGAAHRRALGVELPRTGVLDPSETHEHCTLRHVEELCGTTAYPERADALDDGPLIQ